MKHVPITYRKSFLAKYILSDDRVKYVYTKLKNKLLSIDKMKSRISWFYDAFNIGRLNIAKISVRGKYVALYLNLNTADYPENIYHQEDVSDRRRYKDTSFKVHVKSDRTIKYAFRLIDDCIKKFDLKTNSIPNENYYLNYEDEEPLVKRGLIEIVSNNYVYSPKEQIEIDNYVEKDDEYTTKISNDIIFVDGSKVFIKERKSFEARLIQSSKTIQNYYSSIKNKLLTFTNVKARMSWKYETFFFKRIQLAKLQIRGRYLVLCLNLDLSKYKKDRNIEDASKYETFKETPCMIRLKDDSKLEYALELIQSLKRRFLLEEGFIKENHSFTYQYASDDDLVKKGLIKVYAKFGDYQSKEEKVLGDEAFSKKKNNFPVYKEERRIVLSVDENNNFIEKEEIVKIPLDGERTIVNLDVICDNFNENDTITIEELKKLKLIPASIQYFKVIYRGGNITKKLNIIAQSCSPMALKVVESAGGTISIRV